MFGKKTSLSNKNFYIIIVLCCSLILSPFILFRDRLFVITTRSMEPTLNVGDLVVRGDKDPDDIVASEEKGDILILRGPDYFYKKGFDPIFWGNLEEGTPIIHRAIDKKKIGDKWYFKTKGDNNIVSDGGYKFLNKTKEYDYLVIEYNNSEVIYISETEVLGVVIFKIPYLGYFKIFFPFIITFSFGLFFFYLLLKILNYEIKIVKIDKSNKKR